MVKALLIIQKCSFSSPLLLWASPDILVNSKPSGVDKEVVLQPSQCPVPQIPGAQAEAPPQKAAAHALHHSSSDSRRYSSAAALKGGEQNGRSTRASLKQAADWRSQRT